MANIDGASIHRRNDLENAETRSSEALAAEFLTPGAEVMSTAEQSCSATPASRQPGTTWIKSSPPAQWQ